MMTAINVFVKFVEHINWGFRLWGIGKRTCDISKEVGEYNKDKWQLQDYIGVGLKVGGVVGDLMTIKTEYNIHQQPSMKGDEVSQPNFVSSESKQLQGCLEEQEITNLKNLARFWNGVSYVCFSGEELLCNHKTIGDIFMSEEGRARFIQLAAKCCSFELKIVLETGLHVVENREALLKYLLKSREVLLKYCPDLWPFFYVPRNHEDDLNVNRYIPKGDHGDLVFPANVRYTIPILDQENEVFRNHICSFSGKPIRYPGVIVTTNGEQKPVFHHFELSAILFHIVMNKEEPRHPVTKQPISFKDVQIDVQVLRAIQNEMVRLEIPLGEEGGGVSLCE